MRFSPVIIGSLAALAFAAESAHAQWSLNGVKVFYNAGNVGIDGGDGLVIHAQAKGLRKVLRDRTQV